MPATELLDRRDAKLGLARLNRGFEAMSES